MSQSLLDPDLRKVIQDTTAIRTIYTSTLKQLNSLKTDNQILRNELESSRQDAKQLRNRSLKFINIITNLKDNVSSLEKLIKSRDEELVELKSKLESASGIENKHQEVVDEYEKVISDLKNERDKEMAALKNEMETKMQDAAVDLEVTKATSFAQVSDLAEKLEELKAVESRKVRNDNF